MPAASSIRAQYYFFFFFLSFFLLFFFFDITDLPASGTSYPGTVATVNGE